MNKDLTTVNLPIAGRMALLVTLFLVLVNIFNSVTGNAPKAEGLTAVETWVNQINKKKINQSINQPTNQSINQSINGSPNVLCFFILVTCHPPQVVSCIIHVFGVLAEYALILKIIQVTLTTIDIWLNNNCGDYPVGEAERCKSPQGIPQSAK